MKNQKVLLIIFVLPLLLWHTVALSEAAILKDNGNGTVTDSATNLMWQQGESSLISGSNAAGTCTSLGLAGYSGWRLPSLTELLSIVNTSFSPTIDKTYFPNATANKYWTADLDPAISGNAMCVGFGSGHAVSTSLSETWYVRCVRTESAPAPSAQLPSVFFTTEGGRTIFAPTDTVSVGLSVSGGDLNLPAYLYLKFNQAANVYGDLWNMYLTTSGASVAPVPIVSYAFPSGAYNLDCISPTYNCLFEFPGSMLGEGTYSFTGYLGDGSTSTTPSNLTLTIAGIAQCNTNTTSGSVGIDQKTIDLGKNAGAFNFTYDTQSIPDQIIISYEGQTLYDTGCVGSSNSTTSNATVPISYSGSSSQILVTVNGDCTNSGNTQWTYSITCP